MYVYHFLKVYYCTFNGLHYGLNITYMPWETKKLM